MKICRICNTANRDDAMSCTKCGTSLTPNNPQNYTYGNGGGSRGGVSILGIISAVAVLLSAFLPYVSALGMSKSLFDGSDGIFVLLIAIMGLVFALFKNGIGMIISGVLAGAVFFIENNSIMDVGAGNAWVQIIIQKEIGYYCLITGAVMLIVSGVIAVVRRL